MFRLQDFDIKIFVNIVTKKKAGHKYIYKKSSEIKNIKDWCLNNIRTIREDVKSHDDELVKIEFDFFDIYLEVVCTEPELEIIDYINLKNHVDISEEQIDKYFGIETLSDINYLKSFDPINAMKLCIKKNNGKSINFTDCEIELLNYDNFSCYLNIIGLSPDNKLLIKLYNDFFQKGSTKIIDESCVSVDLERKELVCLWDKDMPMKFDLDNIYALLGFMIQDLD